MLKNQDAKGFIIGGFPRTVKMLDAYRKMMKMPEKVVVLEVDEDVAKERLFEKFKEIGKSDSIEKIVDDSIPVMKKIQKNFDKESIIKVILSNIRTNLVPHPAPNKNSSVNHKFPVQLNNFNPFK